MAERDHRSQKSRGKVSCHETKLPSVPSVPSVSSVPSVCQMTDPFFACVCLTYRRAHLLPRAIESYRRQTWPADRRTLIVLDDSGQYRDCDLFRDGIFRSVPERYPTLGEKRNAAIALAPPETTHLAVWDDDDVYLPWHLAAAARALRDCAWSIPAFAGILESPAGPVKYNPTQNLYHASWCFALSAFDAVGGYRRKDSGEDQDLRQRLWQAGYTAADPCKQFAPSFLMGWEGTESHHISAMGTDGYRVLGLRPTHGVVSVTQLTPHWPADYVALAMKGWRPH